MYNNQQMPAQRASYKEKTKDNYAFCRNTIDSIESDFWTNTMDDYSETSKKKKTNWYHKMLSNYRLYNNEIDQSDFDSDLNPFGVSIDNDSNFVHAYNKTPMKIDVLCGEASQRPFNFRPYTVSSDGINEKLSASDQLLRDYITARLEAIRFKATQEAQLGLQQELGGQAPTQEQLELIEKQAQEIVDRVMPPDEIESLFSSGFQSKQEAISGKILEFHYYDKTISHCMNDGLKHGLLGGMEYTWVGVENNEPVVNVLNNAGVIQRRSPEVKFIEDGVYAGYRTQKEIADVLDLLGDYLTKKEIRQLEDGYMTSPNHELGPTSNFDFNTPAQRYLVNGGISKQPGIGSYGTSNSGQYAGNRTATVSHFEWRSQKREGFVEFENEYGDIETTRVSEDFVVPSYAERQTVTGKYGAKTTKYIFDGHTLTWRYVPEIWQGIKIDGDIYCCMGPKEHQFRSEENPMKVKLGYHGAIYSAMNAEPISMMGRMAPFQKLFFIVVHKVKKLIAKDRGRLVHFDTTQIDPALGYEKTIYYMDELDIDFYNPLANAEKPGANARPGKTGNSTERSNMDQVMNYISLMGALDMQISDVSGVTPSREGASTAHEAVTNAQQSIVKSMHITEPYFLIHEEIWRRTLESLVQLTREVWKGKSVTKQYILDDGSVKLLELVDDDIDTADMGLFLSNGGKENIVFRQLGEIVRMMATRDQAKITDLIKMLKASSVADLEKELTKSERRQEQRETAAQQQQSDMQKEQTAALAEQEKARKEHEIAITQMEIDAKLKIAEMDSFKFQKDQDINDNNIPDQLEIEKLRATKEIEGRRMALEREKMLSKERVEKEKISALRANKAANKK